MACGLCIYGWDVHQYKYVHIYSDCTQDCTCATPPAQRQGDYIYLPCVPSATTTTEPSTSTTTEDPGTTSDPSTSTTYSPFSTTTAPPYEGLDCIPEKVHYVGISGYGEFHIPVSPTETCVILESGRVACGANDNILSGDILSCPTVVDGYSSGFFSVHVGNYVERFYVTPYSPATYRTLALPPPYDFVAVNPYATYLSPTLDFRNVPLRYIYMAKGSRLRYMDFIYYKIDVPEYYKLRHTVPPPYWVGGNTGRLRKSTSIASAAEESGQLGAFSGVFQQFREVSLGQLSWGVPQHKGIQSVTDLPNTRHYCDPDQKTFGISYAITGGHGNYLWLNSPESFSYMCDIGGMIVPGETYLCGQNGQRMGSDLDERFVIPSFYVYTGAHSEVGGHIERFPYVYSSLPGIESIGLHCCPAFTEYGRQWCNLVCPDNTLGPASLQTSRARYMSPSRHLPFNVNADFQNITCYCNDYCRDLRDSYAPGYRGGCYDDILILQNKLLRMRVLGMYVDVPYVHGFGGCEYYVTQLENPSKPYCNREDVSGKRTWLGHGYRNIAIPFPTDNMPYDWYLLGGY